MRVNNILHSILGLATVFFAASLALSSCDKNDPDLGIDGSEEGIHNNPHGNRKAMEETRNVLLFYECGFNSLYHDLRNDMEEELRRYGILPMGKEDAGHSAGKAREELLARVLEAAARIREEWRREDLLADEKNEKNA